MPSREGQTFAFADFPAHDFPLLIEALHPDTREVVWSQPVAGPGVVYIPALKQLLGHPVAIRITFATGEVIEE